MKTTLALFLFITGCSSMGDLITSPGFWNKKDFQKIPDKTFQVESLMVCWSGPDRARPKYAPDLKRLSGELVRQAPLAASLAPIGDHYGITFDTADLSEMAAKDPVPLTPARFSHHGIESDYFSLTPNSAPGFSLESRQRKNNRASLVFFINEIVFDEEAGKHGLQVITIVSLFYGNEKIQSIEYRLPAYQRMKLGLGRRVFYYTPADDAETLELLKKVVQETPRHMTEAMKRK